MKQLPPTLGNIYQLDGRVPLLRAIPFGLQHILAMFVANLTPITIIAAAGGLGQTEIAVLLQNAMLVAGIATLIQLFPVWRVGSRLPIVMGVSFTFVTVLSTVAANYGYPAVIGAAAVLYAVLLLKRADPAVVAYMLRETDRTGAGGTSGENPPETVLADGARGTDDGEKPAPPQEK